MLVSGLQNKLCKFGKELSLFCEVPSIIKTEATVLHGDAPKPFTACTRAYKVCPSSIGRSG